MSASVLSGSDIHGPDAVFDFEGLRRKLGKSKRFANYTESLRGYFDKYLEPSVDGQTYTLTDPALGSVASCCTQAQAAGLYALEGLVRSTDGLNIAAGLLRDIASRQQEDGGFSLPYNRATGEGAFSDVAELGAAADSLYLLALCAPNSAAKQILDAGAGYVLMNQSSEAVGAIYKNGRTHNGDILNGDIYGALVAARAYSVTGKDPYLGIVSPVVKHISERFVLSDHGGWWPYMEGWDGNALVGKSMAYQATIVAYGHSLVPYLGKAQRAAWSKTLEKAHGSLVQEMGFGPHTDNEAATWAKDWEHAWEIYMALAVYAGDPRSSSYLENRLARLDEAIGKIGAGAWSPTAHPREGKSAVTSQFRKCSSFAGAVVSRCLQELTASVPAAKDLA